MGHLSLKIQTSALFLKAKHAFSLHRKLSLNSSSSSTPSSPSPSPPSSSSSPTEQNSSQHFSTALNTPPSSSSSSTNPSLTATTNSITDATVAPHKTKSKRSSRFKVKTFASFRDRSSSPPLTSSSTSFADPASSGSTASSSSSLPTPLSSSPGATTTPTVTATTNVTATVRTRIIRAGSSSASSSTLASTSIKSPTTTPPSQSAPVFSVNPYSSSWSPSTVSILKSPLRSGSSSKASTSLDLMRCSLYSPAPNLILQPSPAIDLAPTYAAGARSSTSRAMLRCGGSGSSSLLDHRAPVFGPQGTFQLFLLTTIGQCIPFSS
ncbi:hypothetical protein F5H01DRAFT_1412 [Linnemannia elongata]|nr:hypothetical protein F5H01DRAFT_1412 [Linnemannia elongata]